MDGIESRQPGDAPGDQVPPEPARSRRAVLAAAVGGLVGSVAAAVGRPLPARAAAGDPMVVGRDNFASSSGTHLFATSSGGAFWATQYGFGSGVRGDSVSGHGGVFSTQHGDRYGLNVSNSNGGPGTGGAISADGGIHVGLRVTSSVSSAVVATSADNPAIEATTSGINGAVHGIASSASGQTFGVSGVSFSTNGFGVIGTANSSSGPTWGMLGSSSSPSGIGVEGENPAGIGVKGSGGPYGVYGTSPSEFGVGVQGTGSGTSGHGVAGSISSDSATASGLYGSSAGTTSYAGYFDGKVNVSGVLSKGGGSFRIDHPLDPANKILQHSFVESPDMLNIYNGLVVADGRGEARVRLPAWFEVLNRDFRYALTPIGSAMPDLHVAHPVADGAFSIAGARPGGQVSWLVTGIRQDAWANANRIEVELDKPADERGTYLHPREHGHPRSDGLDYPMQQRFAEAVERTRIADAARKG
jgi:trimeric autotransporter adhesin